MNKKQIMPIAVLIVGATIGSGGIWQYTEYKLESTKSKLNEISRLSKLKSEQLHIIREIIELTDKYIALEDCEAKRSLVGSSILSQLQLLRDKYNYVENNLAKLENRDPLETYAFVDKCQL